MSWMTSDANGVGTQTAMTADPREIARTAFARADELERELLARWPHAWREMDRMRADPPMPWPGWCLLPMAAAAGVATAPGAPRPEPYHVAALSALYSWRYCRSVYAFEPGLMSRLLRQIPDAIGLEDVTGLPEWCVYVHDGASGLWMHLEHDVNTGRPELRLLLDLPGESPLPIPIYLDRETVTEALADMRATAVASLAGPGEVVPGQDVRGGELDASVAVFAERVEAYLAIAAYLARPEADVGERGRPAVRPVRRRKPAGGRTTWLVGYQQGPGPYP